MPKLLQRRSTSVEITYFDSEEIDESESSRSTLVVGDEVDLVDVPVPRKVTLEVATSCRVAEMYKHVATKSRQNKHGNQAQKISYNYFEKNIKQGNRLKSKTVKLPRT
jgi:hypothetical protein